MLLTQRIGIGAGVALLLVIGAAVTPPIVVQYRLHAFLGRVHAGMTGEELDVAARDSGMVPAPQSGPTLDFDDPAPWSVASQCRDDYGVVVVMNGGRSKSWAKIKNRLCT